ncbi:MAG: hypothetical protein ABEJ40_07205 [Haloarculaceae archaeon]
MGSRRSVRDRSLRKRLAAAAGFLPRVDYRNLRMLGRTLSILSRPSSADWYYNRGLVVRELPRAAWNLLTSPGEMNAFQRHCTVSGYVSTPVDGVVAGFTDSGRMSTLLAPHSGFTQQVTYFETGGSPHNGVRPRDGAFFGVETAGGDRTWLWESAFDHGMTAGPDPGQITMTATPTGGEPVATREVVAVPPGSETVVRELTVRNVGDAPVERVRYYMGANANDRPQYPPGVTSPNRATAHGRGVRWRDRESDAAVGLFAGPDAAVAGTGVGTGPLAEVVTDPDRSVEGRYVGGHIAFDVSLAPGDETTVTVYTTVANGRDRRALPEWAAGDGERATATDDRERTPGVAESGEGAGFAVPGGSGPAGERDFEWSAALDAVPVERVDDRFAAGYERSVVALAKLFDPGSGSLSAAPNVQPMYYPSWPRDGALTAIALAEAGLPGPATAYLGRYLPRVQEDDGGFAQCYTSDGRFAGVIPRENDQPAIYVHAVRAVYEATGDDAFRERAWPAVRDALEYLVASTADNGLLRATPDFAEMPSDARQSLWTNAFAYRGLLDGARLADLAGADGSRYRRAAGRVGDAVDRRLVGADGVATHLSVWGPDGDGSVAHAAAVHPTGWAGDYGRADALLDRFLDVHRGSESHWLPEEFTLAAALYAAGRTDAGDRLLDRLGSERLPGGTLAEAVGADGDHRFAALGWANAAFVHALHVREGLAADAT